MRLNKGVILLLALCGFSGAAHATFKTSLSDAHVQSVLQRYFPQKEYAAIARVILLEPKVRLEKNNKDIVLLIPVNANIIGDAMHRGHITVLVNLSYQPSSGGLYLNNPRMDQFEMPGVDKQMLGKLHEFIEAILNTSLPLVQIYKLKESDMNHSLAKTALKNHDIEDHRLSLEFGFQ